MAREKRARLNEDEAELLDKIRYLLFQPGAADKMDRGDTVYAAAQRIIDQEADDPEEFRELSLEDVQDQYGP